MKARKWLLLFVLCCPVAAPAQTSLKALSRGFETFISAGLHDIEFREYAVTVRHFDTHGQLLANRSDLYKKVDMLVLEQAGAS